MTSPMEGALRYHLHSSGW